ncbi:MarR family winged helix-turn-helix transcriptional regulator [Saccharopolyspora sp. 5N102]|uniref:MarR family winged helix-turn-helix transcriptional regulator n=1 Tax=Saccharopolyspora sp. 5N102 TaxID=3375155 RepID=UPI0037A90284
MDSVDRMVAEWGRRAPSLDVAPLQVIGRLLRWAEHGQRAIRDALRPLGLSYGDFDVLNTLRRRDDPDGTNPRDLARSSLVTSGAMTARLDRLVEAGLVARATDPSDRRAVLVRLTDRGERLATEALEAVLAADEELLAPLDDAQREQLAALLKTSLAPHEAD